MTTLNSNQFAQSRAKGMLDKHANINIMPVLVDPASVAVTGDLIPGVFVKFADVAGDLPVVDAAVNADTDKVGVIFLAHKSNDYLAGDKLEIAFNDTFVWMEASAAIAAGANVEWDDTTNKIATVAAGEKVGVAWTKALADTDLVLVQVKVTA